MTAAPALDLAVLEARRRITFRAAVIALLIAGAGFPLGAAIGGSERRDSIGGALLLAAIAGIIAVPWLVRAWQRFMKRRMIAAAVAGRPDIHHIDGENRQAASQQALSAGAFSLAAFRDSGLVEPFVSAGVTHILTGEAQGVPFAIAEISLRDAKGYQLFGGVGHGCGSAPPIYVLHSALAEFARASTDAELREFVRIMQSGTDAQQEAAVQAACDKALTAMHAELAQPSH